MNDNNWYDIPLVVCGVVGLPQRKLHAMALGHFGVKVGMSEVDGKTPTVTYFPYTRDGEVVRYKYNDEVERLR